MVIESTTLSRRTTDERPVYYLMFAYCRVHMWFVQKVRWWLVLCTNIGAYPVMIALTIIRPSTVYVSTVV